MGGVAGDKPTVHPNDVAKTINEFVLQRQQVKTKGGGGAGASTGTGAEGSSALAALLAEAGASHVGGVSLDSVLLRPLDSVLLETARKARASLLALPRLPTLVSSHTRGRVGRVGEMATPVWRTCLEERSTLSDDRRVNERKQKELFGASDVNKEVEIPPIRLSRGNGNQQQQQQTQQR